MKNLWEMIAKERGLKIGEEFTYSVNECYGDANERYINRITKEGLQYQRIELNCSSKEANWQIEDADIIMWFLSGEGIIGKAPMFVKPIRITKHAEKYLYVDIDGKVCKTLFYDALFDIYCRKMGNMFPVDAVLPQEQIDDIMKRMNE